MSSMALSSMNHPPAITTNTGEPYVIDKGMPLHGEAVKRMNQERDLKILITAQDSETGVGKTTLAGFLAMTWNWCFSGEEWDAETYSTVNPHEYFKMTGNVPRGTVLVVDDAEELDARRSMQNLNVEFSWKWMLDRYKQLITIITLPSPGAIDSRIEELADVWVNVTARGSAMAHPIKVQNYGSRDTWTPQEHEIRWPDVSHQEAMQIMREKKEAKSDRYDTKYDDDATDEDDEMSKTQQTFLAIALKEKHGVPWRKVDSDLDDRLTYSGETYRQHSKEVFESDE